MIDFEIITIYNESTSTRKIITPEIKEKEKEGTDEKFDCRPDRVVIYKDIPDDINESFISNILLKNLKIDDGNSGFIFINESGNTVLDTTTDCPGIGKYVRIMKGCNEEWEEVKDEKLSPTVEIDGKIIEPYMTFRNIKFNVINSIYFHKDPISETDLLKLERADFCWDPDSITNLVIISGTVFNMSVDKVITKLGFNVKTTRHVLQKIEKENYVSCSAEIFEHYQLSGFFKINISNTGVTSLDFSLMSHPPKISLWKDSKESKIAIVNTHTNNLWLIPFIEHLTSEIKRNKEEEGINTYYFINGILIQERNHEQNIGSI